MNTWELAFFSVSTLLVLLGGVSTVAAKNPIRGAMGLLASVIGIAAMYLMLSAELLAAIQVLVYAGAVVILFLFVIMILGPSATSGDDRRSAVARYVGAGVFLLASLGALWLVLGTSTSTLTILADAPVGFGSIESIGSEMYTRAVVPFELSGALLLIAVVGAVAVARGKQVDPTSKGKTAEPAGRPAETDRTRTAQGHAGTEASR